jgi:hypothetical protein
MESADMVVHTCNPGYWDDGVGGSRFKGSPGQKHKTLSEKIAKTKRAGGVTEVAQSLPSKHKAISSNPSTRKK